MLQKQQNINPCNLYFVTESFWAFYCFSKTDRKKGFKAKLKNGSLRGQKQWHWKHYCKNNKSTENFS